ncbi:MAG: hypothetical protein F6K28_34905 [Microcoleus sp. SIO2G3]|nr:hypothetical protein [Microcoleus sp. SIO2G3]
MKDPDFFLNLVIPLRFINPPAIGWVKSYKIGNYCRNGGNVSSTLQQQDGLKVKDNHLIRDGLKGKTLAFQQINWLTI